MGPGWVVTGHFMFRAIDGDAETTLCHQNDEGSFGERNGLSSFLLGSVSCIVPEVGGRKEGKNIVVIIGIS